MGKTEYVLWKTVDDASSVCGIAASCEIRITDGSLQIEFVNGPSFMIDINNRNNLELAMWPNGGQAVFKGTKDAFLEIEFTPGNSKEPPELQFATDTP